MMENKTRRVELLMKPTDYEEIKKVASDNNISVNNLINQFVSWYIYTTNTEAEETAAEETTTEKARKQKKTGYTRKPYSNIEKCIFALWNMAEDEDFPKRKRRPSQKEIEMLLNRSGSTGDMKKVIKDEALEVELAIFMAEKMK